MASLKQISLSHGNELSGGHRACTGCLSVVALRQAFMGIDFPVVLGGATGCMEVVTTIYPYTAWNVPYIHSAFANAAATVSGVEAAYRALRRRGKMDKTVKFVVFGGDGGSYDIGLQSLSGAMERGHHLLYICYDNEGYMNTGIQRSSATPLGAGTTTSPNGRILHGKTRAAKNLTEIMIAHDLPYVAQASISHWKDYIRKVEKAVHTEGPAFINVLAPCTLGWKFPPEQGINVAKLAVETCFWPLYEVEEGRRKLSYLPKGRVPIAQWTKLQGRFQHLHRPENEPILRELQAQVDRRWEQLLLLCGEKTVLGSTPQSPS